jgi:hypothetical protein
MLIIIIIKTVRFSHLVFNFKGSSRRHVSSLYVECSLIVI